jgi:hypothetical protein
MKHFPHWIDEDPLRGAAPSTNGHERPLPETPPEELLVAVPQPDFCADLVVRMPRRVLDKVQRTVGSLHAERGGVFVGRHPLAPEDFIFDEKTDPASAVYYPAADYLNAIIERDHVPRGQFFIGVGHSHPVGFWRPSGNQNWGDVKAARSNLLGSGNEHLDALFIPIIESQTDTGRFWVYPFVMLRKGFKVLPVRLDIID